MSRPIRWLHLSDLHYGCPGKELWEHVEDEFFRDLDALTDRLGPPDLVLFTGDLAYSGTDDEYAPVDAFLDELVTRLVPAGAQEPLLVPVPGNHDVARPQGRAAREYHVLNSFDGTLDDPVVAEIHQEIWHKRDASFIDDLFPCYRTWFERRIRPRFEAREMPISYAHLSHFPCDFTVVAEPEGAFPLVLVGLNSTWLQYTRGSFEGKLSIPLEQLRAALAPANERKPYAIFERAVQSLLLMHQPPDWFSENAKKVFDADIYPGGRFSACLYGHMHKAKSRSSAAFGGPGRCFMQAPSLFGVEQWGTSGEDRKMGYACGEIRADGQIRVWPRESRVRGDGRRSFGFDNDFHAHRDGNDPESALVRSAAPLPADARAAESVTDSNRGSRADLAEIEAYLRELRGAVRHLELQGLTVDDQHRAVHPLLTQLYTPVRGIYKGALDTLAREQLKRPPLEELLSRGTKILIEGPPGCGKSTFLRFVTSLLIAPALGDHVDNAHSRNVRRLAIGSPIPILLRLEGMGRVLAAEGLPASRERLLDLLEVESRSREVRFDRLTWRERLEDGRACLLLDGLDEIAATKLRERLLSVLGDAARRWKARILVASRPFLTEGLVDAGFLKIEVAPFDDDDVRFFLDKWVAMLNEEDLESARTAAVRQYRRKLEKAILRPDVRQLATNPMMLTCLCLVHWSRGELPQGRARIYQAVLKWLVEARRERRLELFRIPEAIAYEALADLALWATAREDGKQASFELDAAAIEVAPALERIRPELNLVGRRQEARRWLIFEAEGSGVVEELQGDRLRFWHLTFQEYLAGWRLAQLPAGDDWWPRLKDRLDDSQWRETVELFASCLQLHSHASHVDRLLKLVLSQHSGGLDLARDARVVAILGRLLPSVEIYDYSPAPAVREAFEELSHEVMAIFQPEGAARVPIKDRIAAAEALGRGGDPRFRPDIGNFLSVPDIDVCIGKYPVTVEEFRRFVDARGYEDERWWPEGWQAKEINGWEVPGNWTEQLSTPNRPVVEISWWEAAAYCRWLSDHHGTQVRLPLDMEWQVAAGRTEGRKYAWGSDKPDQEIVNFGRNVGAPTPVGVYPLGMGMFGHLDLAGNVWEWLKDDLDNGKYRPLRGGTWWYDAVNLQSADLYKRPPNNRFGYIGFRVCHVAT